MSTKRRHGGVELSALYDQWVRQGYPRGTALTAKEFGGSEMEALFNQRELNYEKCLQLENDQNDRIGRSEKTAGFGSSYE